MENIQKYILPFVAGGLLSISSCGKQPGSAFVETIPSKPTVEKTKTKPKHEVKVGLLSVDDSSIPQAVKDRFNKMVLLNRDDKTDCHANPAKIDNKSVYLTSAHCRKQLNTQVNERYNLSDAPVYSQGLKELANANLTKVRLFQFPKVIDGTLIYFGVPTINNNSNSRKVFVGHSITLNTENGVLLATKEELKYINASGSSGSFVSDGNGKLLGTMKGWSQVNKRLTKATDSFGNDLEDSTSHLVANTGRETDKSKMVITYISPMFVDGTGKMWVPDSQKTK
jgi:hypothetical protein